MYNDAPPTRPVGWRTVPQRRGNHELQLAVEQSNADTGLAQYQRPPTGLHPHQQR